MEKVKYIRFIANSHSLARFISTHSKKFDSVIHKDGAILFLTEDREYPYYPGDIQYSGDEAICVENIRFDWIAKDMAGVGEQPVSVMITMGKLKIEIDY